MNIINIRTEMNLYENVIAINCSRFKCIEIFCVAYSDSEQQKV